MGLPSAAKTYTRHTNTAPTADPNNCKARRVQGTAPRKKRPQPPKTWRPIYKMYSTLSEKTNMHIEKLRNDTKQSARAFSGVFRDTTPGTGKLLQALGRLIHTQATQKLDLSLVSNPATHSQIVLNHPPIDWDIKQSDVPQLACTPMLPVAFRGGSTGYNRTAQQHYTRQIGGGTVRRLSLSLSYCTRYTPQL